MTELFDQVRPDYVVLAAGRVGGVVANQAFPADFMDESLAIQLNLLKTLRRRMNGIEKSEVIGIRWEGISLLEAVL